MSLIISRFLLKYGILETPEYGYDKVSANGYISAPPRPQISDDSQDVENRISTWFSESSDAQLSEYV